MDHLWDPWKKFKPDFLLLSETKLCFNYLQKLQFHFSYNKLFTVENVGLVEN